MRKAYLLFLCLLSACAVRKPIKSPPPQGQTLVTVPASSIQRAEDELKLVELLNKDVLNMDVKKGVIDISLRIEIEKMMYKVLKERVD